MPYHPDRRLSSSCNRTANHDNQEGKSGWKSILLLQFQSQFRIAMTLGILSAYFTVTYQTAYALGSIHRNATVDTYMSDSKGILYAFDGFYLIDILCMVIFKRIEWPEMSHLYKSRHGIVIAIEAVSLFPVDAIYYHLVPVKYEETITFLRLRYVLRLIRIISDKMEPKAMTKRDTLMNLTINFLLMVNLTAATITFAAHPYICLLDTHKGNCTNPYSYYLNYYVALERITGKGFGETFQHHYYRNNLTFVTMTTISFLAYFILGYCTSKMICNLISTDAITFSFLLNVTTLKNTILEWKYRNKHVWKNYHESLYHTCIGYFEIIWEKRKCSQSRTLVQEIIPAIMFKEIYLDMSWQALKHSHLFRPEETHFLRKVSEFIKHKFYAPGEIIYRQRIPKSSMVYVTNGTIDVISRENGEVPIFSLSTGTCLGESSLVLSYPSRCTVVCKTYCELEVLEKRDFVKLCAIYPQKFRTLTKRICKRYMKAKRLDDILKYQWRKYKVENPEIVTMMFTKRTLHQLLKNSYKVEDVSAEWDQSCVFHLTYFNMYVIADESELETDSIFLRKQFPVILQPSSIFIDSWNISIGLFSMMLAIIYPIYVYYCSYITGKTHLLVYAIITILWCLDIYIQISTAVRTKNNFYTTISSITYHRLSHTSFLMDIVSTLPFGWLLLITQGKISYQIFLISEIHKLLKAHKIKYTYSKLEGLNLFNTIVLRYVKAFMVSFFLFYYTGMVFYCLVCENTCSTVYLRQLQIQTNLNVTHTTSVIIHLYALASLFIADMSYFDFMKVIKGFQIFMVIVVQLLYTFVNISILAFMAIVETLKEKENHRYKEFIISMDNMGKDFKVSALNQKRIQFYLKNNYWFDKGVMMLNPTLFIDNMSPNLYSLYRHVLYGKFLHNIPLFQDLEEKILIEAVRFLKVKNFPSGEVITYAGEVCKEMHVIEFGYCTMKSKEHKILERTDSFCVIETCLQIPTFYTVVTVTDCSILSLDYNGYSQIANKYPEFRTITNEVLKGTINARGVQKILNENENNTEDEDFVFEPNKKDVSFRRFIYSEAMRLQKKTQFEVEFHSFKIIFRFLLLRYTFTSHGRFLFIWEIFRFLFALVTNVAASSTKLCTNCDTFYILLVLDTTAWIDLYVRHHVCYFNRKGIEVSHPMRTAMHYWKTGFLIDLLAALPMDYFVEDGSKMYFRMNRVLQLHRAFGFIKYINDNNTARSRLFEICKYMPITLLLINYVSAINMYMTCDIFAESGNVNYSCAVTSWRDEYIFHSASGSVRLKTHTAALLLTTTSLALIGFSDVSIEHKFELCTIALMILIGHIFFVWITARMVADNFFKKSDLTNYQEAMKQLLKFVNYRKVDKNIKKEIIHYFEFMWLKTKGKELKCLLKSFNTAIKEDILFDMFGRIMQQSTIFLSAAKSFFKSLLLEAKYEVYINRGIIYRVNDIHGYVFFILKGNVEVIGPDYNKLLILPAGSIFGNLDNCPLTRQTLMMVAMGNVELLKLSSTFFHSVLSKYPTLHNNFNIMTSVNVDYLENWSMCEETSDMSAYNQISITERKYTGRMRFFTRLYLKSSKVFEETIYLQIWKTFVLIVACYIGFSLTMLHMCISTPSLFGLITAYAIDAIYLINIYLEFHTSYKNEYGTPVRSRRLIAKNYLKKPIGFYLDLISSLPIESICLTILNKNYVWVVWARIRVNRSVRIVHVFNAARMSKEKLHVNIIVIRVLYIICWITIILQVLTVLLYISMEWDRIGKTGIDIEDMEDVTRLDLLGQCYMIIVALSTGTALVNLKVKFTVYSAMCIVIITLTFRFLITIFIGETAGTLEAINQSKSTYKQFALHLKQYMIMEDISVPLRKRIGQYINLLWIFHRGVQLPSLLHEAPYYLREAILNAMFGFHLRRHKILSHFHVDLIRQMAAELNVLVFFPGNYVVYKGDIDQCMYFIHTGEVEVIAQDTLRMEVVKETLVIGDVFGLIQGLFGDVGHRFTYKVSKYTIIIALERSRWIRLLQFFPASKSIIESMPREDIEKIVENRETQRML